jgi:hypothetical protein
MIWNLLFTNKELMICYERIERAVFFSLFFVCSAKACIGSLPGWMILGTADWSI